jgi:hypothetical protein
MDITNETEQILDVFIQRYQTEDPALFWTMRAQLIIQKLKSNTQSNEH